uniref:Uncharacterized protein n=1 Tax=Arundo donax TaxID=35708 RepID=A0A0A9GYY2_ARUDO
MVGLQRSAQTFRRSGSSGLVWDERFLAVVAEDGGSGAPQRELRHSRSVGSIGVLRRRGRDKAGDVDGKTRKLVIKPKQTQKDHKNLAEEERPGRKAFRTRDVAPAADSPSPRVSGCCALRAVFRTTGAGGSSARRARPRER